MQHMLLPHEVVSSFLHEGETRRMTGPDTWIFSNVSQPTQKFHSKHQFYCGSFDQTEDLSAFWEHYKGLRWFQQHPLLSESWLTNSFLMSWNSKKNQINFSKPQFKDPETELKHVIPIRLFGDGAEAQRILVQPLIQPSDLPKLYMVHGLTWPK